MVVVGSNLVRNPSFEQPATGSVLPAHWSGDEHVFRRDEREARTGSASLRYENRDKQRYVLCTQPLKLEPGRLYRFSVWVKTADIKGPPSDRGAAACIEWSGPDGRWLGGSYAVPVTETSDWTQIKQLVRFPENAVDPRLSLYLRKNSTGTAWFDDVEVVRVARPALQTIVASPIYRGWILSGADGSPMPSRIIVRATAELRDYDLAGRQVTLDARLRRVKTDGSVDEHVLQQYRGKLGRLVVDDHQLQDAADVTFSAEGLAPGTYEIETKLVSDGGCLGTTHERIRRQVDRFRPRSYVDEHRRLIVDGKPFFPLGMYWHAINEKDMAIYADSKFNCLMPYSSPRPDQMNLAHRHGLKVIYTIKDWYFGTKGCPGFIKRVEDEGPAIRKRVRALRNHPALLAWYLNDELSLTYLDRLKAHQQIVAEEDPDHPTWAVLYQVHQIRFYRGTFDVIGSDPYPIGRKPDDGGRASLAGQWTIETARQLSYARPLWQVPQVFNWKNYWGDDRTDHPRSPTYEEMRSMAWQCIAEGATGLIFYSWFDIKRNPDVPFEQQWERLKRIAAEIDRMTPILLSVEPVPSAQSLVGKMPRGVHVLVRRHKGKLYVIAVNDGAGDAKVTYRLKTTRRINVLGENRTIPPADGGFSDRSERLSVHIYEVDAS